MAKKNLPACKAVAAELGYADLFDSQERNQEDPLTRTKKTAEYYKKHGKYPARNRTKYSVENCRLGDWLIDMRCAKNGKSRRRWYPECEELAIELGCPDMFESNR